MFHIVYNCKKCYSLGPWSFLFHSIISLQSQKNWPGLDSRKLFSSPFILRQNKLVRFSLARICQGLSQPKRQGHCKLHHGGKLQQGMLSTVDLIVKIACFVKTVLKGAGLNWLVQGGQIHWTFPFSKGSLASDMLTNIRQGQKCLPETNTLAYFSWRINTRGKKKFYKFDPIAIYSWQKKVSIENNKIENF